MEHAIGHIQATALKGRRFESIEDQNAFLEHWEAKWAASRECTRLQRATAVDLVASRAAADLTVLNSALAEMVASAR